MLDTQQREITAKHQMKAELILGQESILERRTSVGRYDNQQTLTSEMVSELVRLASLSPSAFNMQNWQFVAVHSASAKQKLYPLAFNQPQVLDAAVTYIVCGKTMAYQTLAEDLQASVDANIINKEVQQTWVEMATQSHENDAQVRRDEAVRSASLAAMSLMVAAQEKGLASGAMGGFDADAVKMAFDLDEDSIPVILLTVGYPAQGNWPQKKRKPVSHIMRLV